MYDQSYKGVDRMSIDHIGTSTLLKHPVYSPSGDLVLHDNKISHAHRAQSGVPVPPIERADFLQPTKDNSKSIGKLIDIKV
jgi:hypothetical protein